MYKALTEIRYHMDIIKIYLFILYINFIYNQIPPQSEENDMLHKKNIDKIIVYTYYVNILLKSWGAIL